MQHLLRRTMSTRTYSDAVNALNGLQTNFSVIDAIRKAGGRSTDMAIPEMLEWARRAGYNDAREFDKLNAIHVTGTKGKGSTCAFVQSILEQFRSANGPVRKIGLYTSPHLKTVRERIRINGEPLSEEKFAQYFYEVWDTIESSESDQDRFERMGKGDKPNYFRYLTLLSFHAFLREGVDAAIYEVGIGGEYDSTNILVHPSACGVSALGLDHVHILGNTLEEIAWNKAGIFKNGAKAFTSQQPEGPLKVLAERAEEKKTTLTVVPVHPEIPELELGLAGEFQQSNASLAVALAAEHLKKKNVEGLDDVSQHLPSKFKTGLEKAEWAGRCQTKRDGSITWYLDGAHTRESIAESAKWFSTVADKTDKTKRVLIFNQQTRDANALVSLLHQILTENSVHFDHVIFTTNVTWSSGVYSADLTSLNTNKDDVDKLVVQNALAEAWNGLDSKAQKHVSSNLEDATNIVRGLEGEVQVLCTGSLLMVGGLLTVLEDEKPKSP